LNILGLYDGHNASAALIEDGVVVAAVEEERFSRVKNHDGRRLELSAPKESVKACLKYLNGQVDFVAIALEKPETLAGNINDTYRDAMSNGRLIESAEWNATRVAKDAGHFQTRRIAKILEAVESIGVDLRTTQVVHVNHHRAHAASVYFTSGKNRALIVTLDGKGDNLSGTVSLGTNGTITLLQVIDHLNSLGHFYSAVAVVCGFAAIRDEGKVTGLAAYGRIDKDLLVRFRTLFQIVGGTIVSRLNDGASIGQYPSAVVSGGRFHVERIRAIVEGFEKSTIAATAQEFLEEIVVAFVHGQLQRHGTEHLQVAGGLFANVRLNQRLASLSEVDSFVVHPAMSDAGLAVGAALECHYATHLSLPQPLSNAFLGPDFSSEACEDALKSAGFAFHRAPHIERHVARLLADGEVVCRFAGRLEYGPRALGNRSILYRADDTAVSSWLNRRLRRTETMPFAPATLDEFMDVSYYVLRAARGCDEYMTVTYDCKELMRQKCPAVVHLDGTARPQRVCRASNPELHSILTMYHSMTGVPSVINTSFNIHESPIVCTTRDAFSCWEQMGFR
jgi:carbamoyltransferase